MTVEEFYGAAEYGWTEQAYETRRVVREFCEEKTVADPLQDMLARVLDAIMGPHPIHQRVNDVIIERALEELRAQQERADRPREENAKLREGLRKVERVYTESQRDHYDFELEEMGRAAREALNGAGQEVTPELARRLLAAEAERAAWARLEAWAAVDDKRSYDITRVYIALEDDTTVNGWMEESVVVQRGDYSTLWEALDAVLDLWQGKYGGRP